ncbi:crossover junction endodeoxyribonuclease RuvC [Candidatus Peregrinibacteria bacterium]|nr:crossover junction endodeoxyribonuclease RuvC [Candidatus Peregrinibacteria bacterium]
MGIDPGIERTGFAVLEMEKSKITVLDFGRIFTDKRHPFSHRLNLLATDLKNLIRQWKPQAASIEQIFFSKNVKTAMRVSHARGVILETLEEHGIQVQEFNPAHIKLAVTGDAKADKLQMKKMVQYLLGIALEGDDATDAIACALCMLHTNTFVKS